MRRRARDHRFTLAVAAALAVAVTLCAGGARAQGKRDPAAADEAFRAALAAKEKGDLKTACAKFEASMQLDPAPSTLLNVAECLEREGKLAKAWSEAQRALKLTAETPGEQRRRELESYANGMIDRLRAKMAWVRVEVPEAPAGMRVERDGVELPLAVLDQAIPADPGKSQVTATAPGFEPFRVELTLAEGKTSSVTITLTPSKGGPGGGESPGRGASGGSSRVWPWIAGGAGVALIGAGIGFAVSQAQTQADIDANCHQEPSGRCRVGYDYQSANDRLYRDFGLFVGLGGAGVIALGAGVLGLALRPAASAAPEKKSGAARGGGEALSRVWATPVVGAGGGGLSVGGVF